jgi:hypothetical protein
MLTEHVARGCAYGAAERSRYVRITAVTRHLVVYSGPESLKADNTQGQDRFSFNANVTEHDLEDYFYPPFEVRDVTPTFVDEHQR